MSTATRSKPTRMTVCDLCDGEIPDGQPDEGGSLTAAYGKESVEVRRDLVEQVAAMVTAAAAWADTEGRVDA